MTAVRLVQAVSLDLQSHIAAAVSADRFSEADALQGELDAATADAAALESAHHFTDKDLGSSLQSLTTLSSAKDTPAAGQPTTPGPSLTVSAQDENSAQRASGPEVASPSPEQPVENGAVASPGGDLEPHTKLNDVAAAEAARPASAQVLQRPDSSGSRGELAAIGLSRQLTDECTLSGYITDSDSAAEVTPTLRGDPAGSGAQLPFAAQLQSDKSREALSAGLSAPAWTLVSQTARTALEDTLVSHFTDVSLLARVQRHALKGASGGVVGALSRT